MTKVKVCGLMEQGHVKTAVEAGVDAIGFVFAPSSRRITVDEAKELAQDIPASVMKIGVFVNETRRNRTYFQGSTTDYVQYHGDESPEFIESINLPSIRALL